MKTIIIVILAMFLLGCTQVEQIPVQQCNIEKQLVATTFNANITECASYAAQIEELKLQVINTSSPKIIYLTKTQNETNETVKPMEYLVMLNRLKAKEEELEKCYAINETESCSAMNHRLNNCELKLNKTLEFLEGLN